MPEHLVRRIVSERASGRTLRAIAETLTTEGVPTARGGPSWSTSTVQGVIASTTALRLGARVQ
ncbi:MAG: recombinase family protein [Jiangellaceae bacterium]